MMDIGHIDAIQRSAKLKRKSDGYARNVPCQVQQVMQEKAIQTIK
jgi:hypothetical protein